MARELCCISWRIVATQPVHSVQSWISAALQDMRQYTAVRQFLTSRIDLVGECIFFHHCAGIQRDGHCLKIVSREAEKLEYPRR